MPIIWIAWLGYIIGTRFVTERLREANGLNGSISMRLKYFVWIHTLVEKLGWMIWRHSNRILIDDAWSYQFMLNSNCDRRHSIGWTSQDSTTWKVKLETMFVRCSRDARLGSKSWRRYNRLLFTMTPNLRVIRFDWFGMIDYFMQVFTWNAYGKPVVQRWRLNWEFLAKVK